MKRLKKTALAVACAVVLCSVFSGCGGDKKDTAKAAPAEEKVLTVYTARSESLNNLVIPAFEKETGIKVNVIVAGTGPPRETCGIGKGQSPGRYSLGG